MSQDGSSSKSYIKHPTEKARLDNLAFTSFPEDYLPYTSPSYQRKAPYLVWDHQHHYGGGGLFRARRRRLRLCCSGAAALASAIALLVAAILAIVAVSVYLGVVTNLFRSPIFSLSGKFRVVEGDDFQESLLNQTSYEFLSKAEYYKILIENIFSSSSLAPAFVAARVYAFRPGSVQVFFRLHLDRRKLVDGEPEALLVAKHVLLEQAIDSPSQSFDHLVLDLPSIEVREYDDESWLMGTDFSLEPGEVVGHVAPANRNDSSSTVPPSVAESSTSATTSSVSTQAPTSASSSQESPTRNYKRLPTTRSRITPPTRSSATASSRAGAVGYGYAEWKPIDLPEAIMVSSLGAITPGPKRDQVPVRSGSVSSVEQHRPQLGVVTHSGGSARQPNVASSITSSVSLVIRPSSRNKTRTRTSGVVTKEKDLRFGEASLVQDSPEVSNRKNSGSFRFLELSENVTDNAPSEDQTAEEETGMGDLFDELYDDLGPSGFTALESTSTEKLDSEPLFKEPSTVSVVDEEDSTTEISSGGFEAFESENDTMPNVTVVVSHLEHKDLFETDLLTPNSGAEEVEYETPDSSTQLSDEINHSNLSVSTLAEDELTSNDSYRQTTTPFDLLISTIKFIDEEFPTFDEDLINVSENNVSSERNQSFSSVQKPSKHENLEETTILNLSQYPTQETTYQTLESDKRNFSSHTERPTTLAEATTDVSVTLSADSASNASTALLQDLLRFRKIARPHKESGSNPNDIHSKDSFSDDGFLRPGHASTVRIPLNPDPAVDSKVRIDDNVISHDTTPLPTTSNSESSESFEPVLRCLESEMTCGSGECVPLDYMCNMRRDCSDNSDEEPCTCADYLRVLGQPQKLCDGIHDCWDYSDEENCPWCSLGQFACLPSKVCINASQVCDGSNDCPFGTDERYCVKLAEDESRAQSLDYFSEGFLMVRKGGSWGKLCLGSDLVTGSALRKKLDEIGRAVCSTLTYREFEEAVQVHDEGSDKSVYYEIKGHPTQPSKHRTSAIFEASTCPAKGVVRVKCQSLECGMRPMAVSSRRRIVGGQSTGSGAWPWQVALYKEGDFQCGAVMVSDTWLISAGHCFYSTQTSHWTARLGILRRGTELRSPSEQVRRIAQIILHPEYVDKGFINDIALLRMEEPVPFSDYLRPLCLPAETEDVKLWDGQLCSVVGWGKLFEIGHTFPDSLQEVRLPVISTEECRKRIIFLSMYHITDNMFCAGYEQGGHDACLGDSGGPLMCQRQDGRWVLLGVTSNGDGCGRPGRPGVYTKVTQYLGWINQIMNETTWVRNQTTTCLGHRCELGRCVQQYKVCDKRFDCPEGSDEQNCPASTKT